MSFIVCIIPYSFMLFLYIYYFKNKIYTGLKKYFFNPFRTMKICSTFVA